MGEERADHGRVWTGNSFSQLLRLFCTWPGALPCCVAGDSRCSTAHSWKVYGLFFRVRKYVWNRYETFWYLLSLPQCPHYVLRTLQNAHGPQFSSSTTFPNASFPQKHPSRHTNPLSHPSSASSLSLRDQGWKSKWRLKIGWQSWIFLYISETTWGCFLY